MASNSPPAVATLQVEPGPATRRTPLSDHAHAPFGSDRFGQTAERFARFFGTPGFIIGQTVLVVIWIALNATAIGLRWDPYPFILLNLAFSTQAAYAAPLILLAQTRQADRDKATTDEVSRIADVQREHAEQQTGGIRDLLAANTALTQQIATLTAEIHAAACGQASHEPSGHKTSTAGDAFA
jgi:uncharacterized membrane protein